MAGNVEGTTVQPSGHRLGLLSVTLLVIANMIGVGVFTRAGDLLREFGSIPAVMLAWFLGGVAAICGALSYAELGAAVPRNGGEYHLLSRSLHPSLGLSSAVAALIAGFSAPTAAMAQAFGSYLLRALGYVPDVTLPIWQQPATWFGALLIVGLSVLHAWRFKAGTQIQDLFTIGKIALLAGFIVLGVFTAEAARLWLPQPNSMATAVASPAFAVGLLSISFAYTGWNAAVYLSGEVHNPQRNIPLGLTIGTLAVMLVYMLLNGVIYMATDAATIAAAGRDVTHVAAAAMFGNTGGQFVSAMIALGIVSTVSAQIMTGPRVYEAAGHDFGLLRWLARPRQEGGPVAAIVLQGVLSLLLLFTASFETLLVYIGATLSLFSGMVVIGLFAMRLREPGLPRPYRTWGYPFTPLMYLALQLWMLLDATRSRPEIIFAGATTVIGGVLLYFVANRVAPNRSAT